MREILPDIQRWTDEGKGVALATVVKVYGSAPRPLGAKMAVSSAGEMSGSVSGGCVEGAVVQEALETLAKRTPKLVAFGISKDMQITAIEVRGPDGDAPDDLNQAAKRYVGKGARGKYTALKAPGAGRAMNDLKRPLSDAFLLAAERIYMYEVQERDYFAFGD